MSIDLIVDDRIVEVLPPLNRDEFSQLEENCLKAGRILDKIKVWRGQNIIVDGLNRYAIAKKHDLPFEIEELDFGGFEDVMRWIKKWQLGRRNMDSVTSLAIRSSIMTTASPKELANILDCSESTIHKARSAARDAELMPEDLLEQVQSGDLKVGRESLRAYACLSDEVREEVNERLRSDPSLALADAIPKRFAISDAEAKVAQEVFSGRALDKVLRGKVSVKPGELKAIQEMAGIKRALAQDLLDTSDDFVALAEVIATIDKPKKRVPKRGEILNHTYRIGSLMEEAATAMKAKGSAEHKQSLEYLRQFAQSTSWLPGD